MAFPHHVAGRRHEPNPHIYRRLNSEAAGNILRFHIRDAQIDAQFMLGTAHARRCRPALRHGARRESNRDSREDHPAQELPHTKDLQ